ncbi:natural cytotoxicity triggering receptor 2 isoform X2 [Rousettus aegyptiacus]|nr:natural cytotoxicity triggering receptor 2 isoform X2 [Rousettus aegyptiacus]
MAWRALPPGLLLLLLPGSWALSNAQRLHSMVGQVLSVRCQYPPRGWPYEKKVWCKEVSVYECARLVASSRPHTLTQASRFSIWDNPGAGFFTVTMTGLTEEDSGHYWCRIYHPSSNSVSKSKRFYLAVSPASVSVQATWAPHGLVSSQTQSCMSPTGRARQASRVSSAITVPSQKQNSTLCSSPAAPSALVFLLCGLLLAKSLMLSALLVQVLRSQHVQHGGRSLMMHPAPARP